MHVHSINYEASIEFSRAIARKTYDVINTWHPMDGVQAIICTNPTQKSHIYLINFHSAGARFSLSSFRRHCTKSKMCTKIDPFIIAWGMDLQYCAVEWKGTSPHLFKSSFAMAPFDFHKIAIKIKIQQPKMNARPDSSVTLNWVVYFSLWAFVRDSYTKPVQLPCCAHVSLCPQFFIFIFAFFPSVRSCKYIAVEKSDFRSHLASQFKVTLVSMIYS